MTSVQITYPAPDGNGTSIVINGVEMNHDIRAGARLELPGNRPPRLTFDLHLVEDFQLCSPDATLIIGSASHDMLVKAGWTPPATGATA